MFQSSRKGPLTNHMIAGTVEKAEQLTELAFLVHPYMLRRGTEY
jgi:site-specific recombinase XerD